MILNIALTRESNAASPPRVVARARPFPLSETKDGFFLLSSLIDFFDTLFHF